MMGTLFLIFAFSVLGYYIGRSAEKNNSTEEQRILRHVIEYIPWTEMKEGIIPIIDSDAHVLVQYQDGEYDSGKASSFMWKNSEKNFRQPIRYYIKSGL